MKTITFTIWCTTICTLLYCTKKCPVPTANMIELDSLNYSYWSLTPENVYREIMREEIKFSDIVLRQAIHETGWFKSHNCLKRKNIFGMKGAVKTDDNPNGYMTYKSWMYSVRAYKRWQRRQYGDSDQDYYEFLKDAGYAENGNQYVSNLKSYRIIVVKG